MSLTAKEKDIIRAFHTKTEKRSDELGSEVISRLMTVFPQAKKSYFSKRKKLSKDSVNISKQGVVVMQSVYDVITKVDDLNAGLLTLSELHDFMLRIDPINFKCILMTMAMMFPTDFTPQVHVAMDKFLHLVTMALQQKYR